MGPAADVTWKLYTHNYYWYWDRQGQELEKQRAIQKNLENTRKH